MIWLRIEPNFPRHPKIAALSDRHFRVWLRVLTNCADLENPQVNEATMRELPGLDSKAIERFAELRLLDRNGEGWKVHDWEDYTPPESAAERMRRYRQRRREG